MSDDLRAAIERMRRRADMDSPYRYPSGRFNEVLFNNDSDLIVAAALAEHPAEGAGVSDPELKAAAETVRRVRACDLHPSSPDARGARARLADAYLAEHPADDGEAVTEEWLRAIGAKENRRGDLTIGPAQWWHFDKSVFGIDHPNGFYEFPTRGHVRRLCAALGVSLTEPV